MRNAKCSIDVTGTIVIDPEVGEAEVDDDDGYLDWD